MINDETMRKLREMNLGEMIEILEMQQRDKGTLSQTFDERFQFITDYVYQAKYNGKAQRLMKSAGFKLPKAEMHDIKYELRGLDKNTLMELGTCGFVSTDTNIVFQGFTGSGKTFLACAVGRQACQRHIRTKYVRLPDLLLEYDEASIASGLRSKLLHKYGAYRLLVIDEWLLNDFSDEELHFVLELIERRHGCASTIFCTQYRKDDWHARLGGMVHADAIMDRIVHNAVWVDSGSVNMREHCAKNRL